MPFIGNQPTQGRFIELDSLTASATDDYTLQLNGANFSPESVNNLLVSINGVIQGSSTMSLNGAVLTVGATLSSSDTIDFVRVFGNVGTVSTPTDGSVTANKIGTGAVDLTSKVSGVLPVANGGTGIVSNPMFKVTGADNVALTNNTYTKVTFNSEEFDVGGYYDSTTNYRYTPQVAGKYLIYGRVYITYGSEATENMYIAIYKNGTAAQQFARSDDNSQYGSIQISSLIEMNGSSDYVEIYTKASSSTNAVYYSGGLLGEFSGYRIGA